MSNNEQKKKLIKQTVFKSIMTELKSRLNDQTADLSKKLSIEKYASEQLQVILGSLSDRELLPNKPIASQKEFESHILKIISLCRGQLLNELKKEYP